MKKQLLILSFSFLFAAMAQAETAYYVQNPNVNIRSEPSSNGKSIATPAKGKSLIFVSKQGSWIKVKFDGKEGYISAYQVSTQPPLEKQQTVIKDTPEETKPTARSRASSYTSAAAARGLTEEERNREGITEVSDFNAVKKMESTKVTPDEVTKFKATGK